jgi:hypothetical protein
VLALLAWEVHRGRDLPVLSLGVTVAAWLTFVSYDERTGSGPFLAYFAWVLPLAGVLVWALYRGAFRRTAPVPWRFRPSPGPHRHWGSRAAQARHPADDEPHRRDQKISVDPGRFVRRLYEGAKMRPI